MGLQASECSQLAGGAQSFGGQQASESGLGGHLSGNAQSGPVGLQGCECGRGSWLSRAAQ
jgi:hypothetical protein